MDNIRYQYFSKEAVEAGELAAFVNLLMTQSYGKSEYYNDIHIKPEDLGAFVVEWCQCRWGDHPADYSFVAVDRDNEEELGIWMHLPDDTNIFVPYADQEREFREWLDEHPEYKNKCKEENNK